MTPKLITVHCSATPNGKAVSGDEIKKWHTDPQPKGRGWKDIGYHGVIEINGDFYRGRADDHMGAHVEGQNDGNLGICLVGTDKFTNNQFTALGWVLRHWLDAYNISEERIFGHYEWPSAKRQGKTCPNIPGRTLRLWAKTGDDSIITPYLIGSPPLT